MRERDERRSAPARKPKKAPAVAAAQNPRESMVAAAAALLGERGLAGTSFSEVIERSGAPRGSIYHHFPEGKGALTAAAMELVGARVLGLFAHVEGETPKQLVERIITAWRASLVASECQAGCPIAAVSNERLEHPDLGTRAAEIFDDWERELGASFRAAGMAKKQATRAATLTLAALEGALILCRARGDVGALENVGAALAGFIEG